VIPVKYGIIIAVKNWSENQPVKHMSVKVVVNISCKQFMFSLLYRPENLSWADSKLVFLAVTIHVFFALKNRKGYQQALNWFSFFVEPKRTVFTIARFDFLVHYITFPLWSVLN
jgi:hypothetical protein